MDEFDSIVEKYINELKVFSQQSPQQPELEQSITESSFEEPIAETVTDSAANETEFRPLNEQAEVIYDNYEEFLSNNPQSGALRFQVYAADQTFPIVSARVTVYVKLADGNREMYDGLTDINGIIDNIVLPAPDKTISLSPESTLPPYSSYSATVEHPDFLTVEFERIPVFSGIKSIQGVEMIALIESAQTNSTRYYTNMTQSANLDGGESIGDADNP